VAVCPHWTEWCCLFDSKCKLIKIYVCITPVVNYAEMYNIVQQWNGQNSELHGRNYTSLLTCVKQGRNLFIIHRRTHAHTHATILQCKTSIKEKMKQWQNGNDKKHNRTHIDQEYASPGAHTARKHVSYGLRSHLSILYICICVCCVCVRAL